jgi:hypothetical protein
MVNSLSSAMILWYKTKREPEMIANTLWTNPKSSSSKTLSPQRVSYHLIKLAELLHTQDLETSHAVREDEETRYVLPSSQEWRTKAQKCLPTGHVGHEKSWWYTMHRSPKFVTCTLNLLSWSRGSEVSWSFGDLLIFCPSCRDSLLVTVTSMNNNMEQFSQAHSFIACLYGEKKSRYQKNIFHSSAFIPKSRKSPFIRGEVQKQLSKVEATTVTTAHTQTEGTFHCTNPTNPPRNKLTCKRIWNATYFSEIIIHFSIDRV